MSKWEIMTLKDIAEFNPRESIKKGEVAVKVAMDKLQPFCRDIPEIQYEEFSGGTKFRNGDTIMARITPCLENGKTAMVNVLEDGQVGFGSTEYIVFRAKKGISDPYFIYYLVCSPTVREPAIKSMVGSSGRQRVQTDVVQNLELEIPPLEEQIKIGEFLKKIDDKIAVNTKINRNLLEQGRTLYEALISDGDTNAKLEDLISGIETGSRPKGGAQTEGVPSVGAEKIECFGVYNYSGEKYISEDYFEKLKKGHVLSGDVLLYKDGAYTGKSSMALDGFPHERCAINEHVFKLNTKDNKYQFFLYFTLDYKQIREYIYTLASSKAAQPGLNQTELLGTEIVMPDEEELARFEKQVSDMMHLIASNAKENKRLAELRVSLLPKLMSGELDVSDLEI